MAAPATARKRSWLARVLRVLVVAAIALPVLYLGGVNVFLALHGLDLMFAGTNQVSAKYKSAYTLWPGRVHVRDLRIVFQDHNLQWSLDFERVSADITLTALARRTFHASSVQASGGVFRMRHRIEPESKDKPWVRALPPIPEFPAPAVFQARVPEAPVSDEEYALWRVHLENVDASVKELWVHYIRYRGAGRAQGKFELLPARKLWVGPASLDLSGGAVHLGDEPLLASLSGRVGCRVDEFDVRVPVGREVLRYINTELRLQGQGFQPKSLLPLFEVPIALGLDAQPGVLAITASVKRGRIQPGAEATIALPRAELETKALNARAENLRIVTRMAPDARGEAVLAAGRIEIANDPKAAAVIELTTPSASLNTRGDDTAGEMEIIGRAVELPRLRVADARALNAFSPTRRLHLTAGTLEGRFSGSELGAQRRADLRLKARSLAGEWNGHALTLTAELEGRGALDSERRNMEFALKGSLERLRLARSERGDSQPYLLDIQKAIVDADVARRGEGVSKGRLRLDAESLAARTTAADGESSAKLQRLSIAADAKDERVSRLAGELTLRAEHGEIRTGERVINLKPELRVALDAADLDQQSGRVQSRLLLRELVATHGDATGQCSTFRAPEARLTLDGEAKQGRLTAQSSIELGKATFDWGDFQASADGSVRIALRDLGLASGVGELTLVAEALDSTLKSGVSERGGWETAAARASATIHAWTGPTWFGSFDFKAPGVEGRIGGTHLSTDVSAKLPFISADIARRTARFDGEVKLTRTVVAAERMVRDWWARIDLRSGVAVAQRNLDLSALFKARLRDVEPGVAILDAGGVLPGWLAGLAPSDELTAEGALNRQCRLTEIRLTRAEDGPVALRGRLQSVSEAVSGAFLVRHSSIEMLSAGVSFGSDTDVSLLAGDGWYSEQSAALDRTALRVLGAPCVVPTESCGVN